MEKSGCRRGRPVWLAQESGATTTAFTSWQKSSVGVLARNEDLSKVYEHIHWAGPWTRRLHYFDGRRRYNLVNEQWLHTSSPLLLWRRTMGSLAPEGHATFPSGGWTRTEGRQKVQLCVFFGVTLFKLHLLLEDGNLQRLEGLGDEGQEKEPPKKVPKLKPRKSIKADGVVADGEDAEVREPRYVDPHTLLAGNLKSRRYRSEGQHLQED